MYSEFKLAMLAPPNSLQYTVIARFNITFRLFLIDLEISLIFISQRIERQTGYYFIFAL